MKFAKFIKLFCKSQPYNNKEWSTIQIINPPNAFRVKCDRESQKKILDK